MIQSARHLVMTMLILACTAPALNATASGRDGGGREFTREHSDRRAITPREFFGPRFGKFRDSRITDRKRPEWRGQDAASRLRYWNEIAIDASGLDHTPVEPGEDRVFGEQIGPGRSSRAMAIVHIAMFDAVNAIDGGYPGYTGLARARGETSVDAAIALAAHDTLAALFPSQAPEFAALLADDLARIPDGRAKYNGIRLGRAAAVAILALRADDGSQHPEPLIGTDYFTSDAPGRWRQDPVSMSPLALGAFWGQVRPFVIASGDQFRAPPPPAIGSPAYAAAYDEVKALGGDGIVTPTVRTEDQTFIGVFWAYDGTPSLCAPPRMYNQVTTQIIDQLGYPTDVVELARLLALVNVTLADTAIAAWESKYFHDYWRPVIGIREADEGAGPTGLGDGNPLTAGDPAFIPLGAPASNLNGPNFTPPFPAYPSGHAAFGGALFQTLRNYYRTDDIAFTFVSDEYNGVTLDNEGNVRPFKPRTFSSLSEAEAENGRSRIYLGIHWQFDNIEGIAQGQEVADFVFENALAPADRDHRGHRFPRGKRGR